MILKVLPVGPLSMNCSVVIDEESSQSAVIDPGADADAILKALENTEPKLILATHGHIDHVGQVKKLREQLKIPFLMHKADVFLLNDPIWNGFDKYVGADLPCPEPDGFLEDGQELFVGSTKLKVLHTPGHTPGHCCFYIEDQRVLIAGDLLFRSSVGRWDLPGGDLQQLKRSLHRVISEIPEDTSVVCGHGEGTTIGREKRFNPLLRDILSRWQSSLF
ncbi:MBL fold metallo-hydrolase [Thermocrinis sp.]|uniref:MBL fold metallo-hydrolase n=1 Tax=Thermocrinis sp. TaxID=2024383 RepID=UPI002FDD3343